MQFVKTADGEWLKPESMNDLMALLSDIGPQTTYRLVAGNTGVGIYNSDGPFDQFIDVTGIPDLTSILPPPGPFIVGAGVALNDFIDALEVRAQADPIGFGYCTQMVAHIRKVSDDLKHPF